MRIRFALAAAAAVLPLGIAVAQPGDSGPNSAAIPGPPPTPPATDAVPTPVPQPPAVLPSSPDQSAPAAPMPSARGDVSANVFQPERATSPAASPDGGAINEAPTAGAKTYPLCNRTVQDNCRNAGEGRKRGKR